MWFQVQEILLQHTSLSRAATKTETLSLFDKVNEAHENKDTDNFLVTVV
jgi:ABC-type microcin C transport system duplicated ATPase subunit YejF